MSTFLDNNYRSISGVMGFLDCAEETLDPDPDAKVDDTLKVSNSIAVRVANKTIHNYKEDCLDLCRVSGSVFSALTLHPHGRNGVTIKGASENNAITAFFACHGTECDIEIGQFDNYWFPFRRGTRGTTVWATSGDAKPIVVRVWNGAMPTKGSVFPTGVEYRKVPWFVWFPYFLWRYAALRAENVVRRLRGLPEIRTK